VGVAVSAVFSGLSSALNSMNGGNMQGVAAIVNGNITMKTWSDVHMLLPYAAVSLTASLFVCNSCNILSLEDKTARGLGVNVSRLRVVISVIAAVLVSVSTAVAGVIGFIGLIVPHIGRILVGSDHKKLVPFSMIFGALVFLCADTVGRTFAAPYEVSASIIMNIVGGPFFIILLRRSKKYV
jgi:iron complex transport system permease protein